MSEKTEYSREQLIDALIAAYRHNKQEGDWNTNETEEQYLERLTKSSMDELIEGLLLTTSSPSRSSSTHTHEKAPAQP